MCLVVIFEHLLVAGVIEVFSFAADATLSAVELPELDTGEYFGGMFGYQLFKSLHALLKLPKVDRLNLVVTLVLGFLNLRRTWL